MNLKFDNSYLFSTWVEKKLYDQLTTLHFKQKLCAQALDQTLRVLEYDSSNAVAKDFAKFILYQCVCFREFHRCNDPINIEQILDPRLDYLFNECSICNSYFVPLPAIWKVITPKMINLIAYNSSYGFGGYCFGCRKSFCSGHVKRPMPAGLKFHEECPECNSTLDNEHVVGRKPKQATRINRKLAYVFFARSGPIPPDHDYCKQILRLTSPDVFEDYPIVCSMATDLIDFGLLLERIKNWMGNIVETNIAHKELLTSKWNAFDSQTNTHFCIIKKYYPKPRITQSNIFEKTIIHDDIQFEIIINNK